MNSEIYKYIFDMISPHFPSSWEKVALYINYFENTFSMNYYVKSEGRYLCCTNYLEYSVFKDLFNRINKYIYPEYNNLRAKDKWTLMTMLVDAKGSFEVKYDYTDFSDYSISYFEEWKKEYLD